MIKPPSIFRDRPFLNMGLVSILRGSATSLSRRETLGAMIAHPDPISDLLRTQIVLEFSIYLLTKLGKRREDS